MHQIAAPEILWRIFTLVESNADLARAARLNKFIGAAALDVLWNDITFKAFLSLFPTTTTTTSIWRADRGYHMDEIIAPLSPKHWHRVNPYACRVKTLRRYYFQHSMQQILTSLKLYDRGSETQCIFPKLQCLIWTSATDAEEMPLVANLLFCSTLKELHFGTRNDQTSSSSYELSLLTPLYILSDGRFPALTKLHLQAPEISGESFNNYHMAVIDLLSQFPEWQLRDVNLILTKDILQLLATFSNLHSLELHDCAVADPSNFRIPELDQTISFKSLESLKIRELRSLTPLTYLEHHHCVPSRCISIYFLDAPGSFVNQRIAFYQIIHLLSQKATLESLELHGSFDLTEFMESLLALPNMKELYLGKGVTFNIDDNALRTMSTKWRNLTHLSIRKNQGRLVSINGLASLHRCPIQSLSLSFTLNRNDIDDFRRRLKTSGITPLYSLKEFSLINFASDGDLVGTVLALTCLFPHAEYTIGLPAAFGEAIPNVSEPGTPTTEHHSPLVAPGFGLPVLRHSVDEILRTRSVVMELLKSPDIVRMIQTYT